MELEEHIFTNYWWSISLISEEVHRKDKRLNLSKESNQNISDSMDIEVSKISIKVKNGKKFFFWIMHMNKKNNNLKESVLNISHNSLNICKWYREIFLFGSSRRNYDPIMK